MEEARVSVAFLKPRIPSLLFLEILLHKFKMREVLFCDRPFILEVFTHRVLHFVLDVVEGLFRLLHLGEDVTKDFLIPESQS